MRDMKAYIIGTFLQNLVATASGRVAGELATKL